MNTYQKRCKSIKNESNLEKTLLVFELCEKRELLSVFYPTAFNAELSEHFI